MGLIVGQLPVGGMERRRLVTNLCGKLRYQYFRVHMAAATFGLIMGGL